EQNPQQQETPWGAIIVSAVSAGLLMVLGFFVAWEILSIEGGEHEELRFFWKRLQEQFHWTWVLVPAAGAVLLYFTIMGLPGARGAGPSFFRFLTPLFGPPWLLLPFLSLCGLYVGVGYLVARAFGWWVVLVPLMTLAFGYVGFMYFRDAKSVGPAWAAFLGTL